MRFSTLLIGMGALLAAPEVLKGQCCTSYDYDCGMNSCSRYFVEGDVLVWKPSVYGIPFGTTFYSQSVPGKPTCNSFEVNSLKFKWNAGVRVGIGYHLPCAGDAKIVWTHFNSHAKSGFNISRFPNSQFFPAYGTEEIIESDTGRDTFGCAKWKLDLNLLDFKFEKKICAERLTITPFAAIRAAWIRQRYEYNITQTNRPIIAFEDDFRLNATFRGAGLRAGFDVGYNVGCGFGIYGFGSGSLLYGRFSNCICERSAIDHSDITNFSGRDHYNDSQSIADCGAGVQWNTAIFRDKCAVTIRVGWEQNVFFNETRFISKFSAVGQNAQVENHNLSVQGVTISGMLDF